jgi:heme oxygenase
LCRLYGFHRPFEVAGRIAPDRTRWIESDLAALGVDCFAASALPRCLALPLGASREYRLGARYVVEGSALGGRSLGRQLDGLLGAGVVAGRRFFTGHGAATGDVWRDYLAHLAAVPDVALKHAAVVDGATETFAIFEQWLEGWDDNHEEIYS